MEKKAVPQKISFCPLLYSAASPSVGCCNVFHNSTALKVFKNIHEYHVLPIFRLDVLEPLFRRRNLQLYQINQICLCGGCPNIGNMAQCVGNDIRHARIVFYLVVMLLQLIEVAPLTTCQFVLPQYTL